MKPLPGLSIETHGPENLGWAGRKTTARLNAKSSDRPKTIRRTQCVACYASELEWLGCYPVREAALDLALCHGCGLVFTNPMLTDEAKQRLQPDVRRLHRSRSSELSDQRALQRSRRRAARWRHVVEFSLAPGSRVLEVGAGDGALIELLLKHGHQPVALDPDEAACEFLRHQFGIEAIACRLEDVRPQALQGFDAVFMLNLIEHLEDPAAAVGLLARSLADGSLLAIETPNLLRTKVGPRRMFSLPHNFYFSPVPLTQLVAHQGFHPLQCRTFHLDMFHLTARRSQRSVPPVPDSRPNAAAVKRAVRRHGWTYVLRGQFLLRKLPWFREWYLYGRHEDWRLDSPEEPAGLRIPATATPLERRRPC